MPDLNRLNSPSASGWKCDFHIHTTEDPCDPVPHTAVELVERAAELGFGAVSITLHGAQKPLPEAQARAEALGVCLIPGIEFRFGGKDIIAMNLENADAARIRSVEDLRAARKEYGDRVFIIAPHPFYILAGSMNHRFYLWRDLFDAVEITRIQTWGISRNGPAIREAKRFGLPVVANSDTHALRHFGQHYSVVEGEGLATVERVFAAIRRGAVRTVCPPLTPWRFGWELADMIIGQPFRRSEASRLAKAELDGR